MSADTKNEGQRLDTTMELVGDDTVLISRWFRAPPRIVFDAWTRPELVRKWWAPASHGVEVADCQADVREGGQYRYVLRQGGKEMGFSGTYKEVRPHGKLVYTQVFEPMRSAGEVLVTVTFEAHGEETRLVSREVYPSKLARDAALSAGMEHGMRETMVQLDAILSQLRSDRDGRVTIERTYRAPIEGVWDLWTTKEGIESWWGPDGFAVTVRKIDLRPEGELLYAMSAVAPEMVAFMKSQGMPTTTESRCTYTDVEKHRRVAYWHEVDFVPGVAPYQVWIGVDLHAEERGTRLVMTLDRMHDDVWTGRAVMGWESELGKLERALAARA